MFDDDDEGVKRPRRSRLYRDQQPHVTTFRYGDDVEKAMDIMTKELRCSRGHAIRTAILAFVRMPYARLLDILPPTPATITVLAPPPPPPPPPEPEPAPEPEPEPAPEPEPLPLKKKVREVQGKGSNRGIYDDVYAAAMAMLEACDVEEVQ
jgi:hypothetical protein